VSNGSPVSNLYQAGGDRTQYDKTCYVKKEFNGLMNLTVTTTMADGSDGRTIALRDDM
jgi:hypothetical protein